DSAMDTPAAEPSSYSTFDTLCGLVFGLAVLVLAVGACLLLGALATYANLESQALAETLVSYGVTCFTSGIPLLIFSYGGWIFLDVARNSRLQVQKTDEILKHLAEINPKYEERLRREQEAAQRRAEAEREAAQRKAEKERLDQEALTRWRAEREQLDRERLAEEERQKSLAAEAARKQENERQQRIQEARSDAQREFDQILAKARKAYRLSDPARIEQLTDEICADIDKLFARLADIDQRFTIKLTKEIGDQFAQHQSFNSLNINLEPA
ncbi:MAG: hypothetical protein ACLQU5_05960, partial [Isosphaeraceae bacterium]